MAGWEHVNEIPAMFEMRLEERGMQRPTVDNLCSDFASSFSADDTPP
jgi:hypothetical protein